MGHEALLRHLIRSAEEKRDGIVARAREEADRLLARARAEAAALDSESQSRVAAEAERERRARETRARAETRRVFLAARAALAGEILARLADRLARLPGDPSFPRIAARLFAELLPELPEGEVVLRTDPASRESLAAVAPSPPFRYGPLPPEELGGIEAVGPAGKVVLRNTLKARLDAAMPDLLVEIGRELGGGPDG